MLQMLFICGELPRASSLKGGECNNLVRQKFVVVVLLDHVAHEELLLVGLVPPWKFRRVRASL